MLGMVQIRPYTSEQRAAVLQLSVRAWAPVFPITRSAVPEFVYDSFYPDGWEARQLADMATVLDEEPENVDLAFDGEVLAGWACTRLHPEDHMAELYVLAVDPSQQRQGVASALMGCVDDRARAAGMKMVMVETGGDPGHAPARAVYESAGYQRWPVARYFKGVS